MKQTFIYWSERSACAESKQPEYLSPRRGKKMLGVKMWEYNFLGIGLLAEHIGLSEAYALPYGIK